MELMTLIYLKETGSILTFATRRAAPIELEQIGTLNDEQQKALKENELKDLVGNELIVRHEWDPTDQDFKTAEVKIPQEKLDQLDVLITKADTNVLQYPRGYFVNLSGETNPVDDNGVVKISTPTATTIQLQTPSAPNERKVWIQINDSNGTYFKIETGKIDAMTTQSDISITQLPPGTYRAFAVVTGFRPVVKNFTITQQIN